MVLDLPEIHDEIVALVMLVQKISNLRKNNYALEFQTPKKRHIHH